MGSGKVSTRRFFGRFHRLSLNEFFDPSTPSMRKVDSREEKRKEKEKKREENVVYSGH